MDDLFRFVLARPAAMPAEEDLKVLAAPDVTFASTPTKAREAAVEVLGSEDLTVRSTGDLVHADLALRVWDVVRSRHTVSAQDVQDLAGQTDRLSLSALVSSLEFQQDEEKLERTLIAAKVLSGDAGVDVVTLAEAMQGYDAIRSAAQGVESVRLRTLVTPSVSIGSAAEHPRNDTASPGGPVRVEQAPSPAASIGDTSMGFIGTSMDAEAAVAIRTAAIDTALASLGKLTAVDFQIPQDVVETLRVEASSFTDDVDGTGYGEMQAPWVLSASAAEKLSPDVRATLEQLNVNLVSTSLPNMVETLTSARLTAMDLPAEVGSGKYSESMRDIIEDEVRRTGSDLRFQTPATALVGDPSAAMPRSKGEVRAAGIGDLLVVKQQVVGYEAGDVAHIENVLRSEHLTRQTRRLNRTEGTTWYESETSREEEQDIQQSDRFSLARETHETLRQDVELTAGLAVTAKYGPVVEVSANVEAASRSSRSESTRQASEFSKDVVARSVNRISERVLDRRSTSSLNEFEEQYSHGFDNTAGTGHIRGVYQWVNKVIQAQMFNYGKRMLFDLTVPEPGVAFIAAQDTDGAQTITITRPKPFTLTADQLTEANYQVWAQRYDVVGVLPPPPPLRTASTSLDVVNASEPHESSGSKTLAIPDGYLAKYARVQNHSLRDPDIGVRTTTKSTGWFGFGGDVTVTETAQKGSNDWYLLVGSAKVECTGSMKYVDMRGEDGSIPIAYYAWGLRGLAVTIQVFCERTRQALKLWQLAAHSAITQGFLTKMQDYESRLAEAAVVAGFGIQGRNPAWNRQIIQTELRKQCLTLLTAQHFEAFGALEISRAGHPQPELRRVGEQMSYVRFFEQAFEWEYLTHHFYPYFWGWKPAWKHKMLLDDVDGDMAQFLRSGAARVVLPVRPGFEAAITHFLDTGKIWTGGQPPKYGGREYVPILKEIQEASGVAGAEVAEGDPWLVRIPTTLTILRDNDDLPSWLGEEGGGDTKNPLVQ